MVNLVYRRLGVELADFFGGVLVHLDPYAEAEQGTANELVDQYIERESDRNIIAAPTLTQTVRPVSYSLCSTACLVQPV